MQRPFLAGLVVQPAAQLGALAEQVVSVGVVALVYGEHAGTVQRADSHRVLVGYQVQQLAQPPPPFSENDREGTRTSTWLRPGAAQQADPPGGTSRSPRGCCCARRRATPANLSGPARSAGARLPRPGPGTQPHAPRAGAACGVPRDVRQRVSRIVSSIRNVAPPTPAPGAAGSDPPAAAGRPAPSGLRRPCADRLDDLQRDAAPEDRTGRQQPPGLIAKQVVAPFDGGTQRLLAVRQITTPADQQPQRMHQPLEDRLRWQQPDPRRGQLDGQGGMLVKLVTIWATAAAFRSSTAKPGTAAACRSANSRTDSHAATDSGVVSASSCGTASGGTGHSCSPDTRKRRAAAHHDPQSARGRQQLRHHRRGQPADARSCPGPAGACGPGDTWPDAPPATAPGNPAARCSGRSTRAPVPAP